MQSGATNHLDHPHESKEITLRALSATEGAGQVLIEDNARYLNLGHRLGFRTVRVRHRLNRGQELNYVGAIDLDMDQNS